MDKTEETLSKSVEEILPNKDGLKKIMEKRKIRVYLGVDPTGAKLHLGHSIPLRKLQEFADLGHEAILLIGTGTVLAGDPSQRTSVRTEIDEKEIEENIKSWKKQAEKIIDFDKVKIKYNGEWLKKLDLPKIIEIASKISAAQLFKREMFQRRIDSGDTVYYHETLYPLLQGYDSVVLDVDLEIGGTDQVFNMLIGRELQKKINNKEKYVLTTPLIPGTNGRPMSKSSRNCIWLEESPREMYAKIMSLSDNQLSGYWKNLTDLPEVKLKSLKPIETKKMLAEKIVKMYHGENSAKDAKSLFEFKAHPSPVAPTSLPTINVQFGTTTQDLLEQQGFALSSSVAKQMITSGSVDINNVTVTDRKKLLEDNQIVKIGKQNIVKVKVKK
jgi:tyrosyl-tRNA synthetase